MTSSKLLLCSSSYWSTVEEKYNMTQPFGDTIFVQITFTPPRLTRIQWNNYQKSPPSPPSSDYWLNQRLEKFHFSFPFHACSFLTMHNRCALASENLFIMIRRRVFLSKFCYQEGRHKSRYIMRDIMKLNIVIFPRFYEYGF